MKLENRENIAIHYCVLFVVFSYALKKNWSGFSGIFSIINFMVFFAYFLFMLIGKKAKNGKRLNLFFFIIVCILLAINIASIVVSLFYFDNISLFVCRLLNCFLHIFMIIYILLKTIPNLNILKEETSQILLFVLSTTIIVVTSCSVISFITIIKDVDLVYFVVESVVTLLLRLLIVKYFSLLKS